MKKLNLMVEVQIEVPNALPKRKTITTPLCNIIKCGGGVVAVYKNENNTHIKYVFYPDSQYVKVSEVNTSEVDRMMRYRYRSYAALPKHFRKHNVIQKLYY